MSQPATDREREGSRLNFRDTIPGPFTFKPLNSGYNEMTATKASVRNEKPRSMAPTLTTHNHFALVLRDLPVDRHEDKMIENNMIVHECTKVVVGKHLTYLTLTMEYVGCLQMSVMGCGNRCSKYDR